MKRKTPKALAEVLMVRHPDYIQCIDDMLYAKQAPLECQAEHIRRLSEQAIVARAEGYNAAIAHMLHEANCYAGFYHVGKRKAKRCNDGVLAYYWEGVREGDPEYAEWRIRYYTNGIAKS